MHAVNSGWCILLRSLVYSSTRYYNFIAHLIELGSLIYYQQLFSKLFYNLLLFGSSLNDLQNVIHLVPI